jgi:hypothetical protein
MNLFFGYAGPVLAGIGFNLFLSLVSTVCVYIYLNRERLQGNKVLYKITKPIHRLISKTAKKNLKKACKKND